MKRHNYHGRMAKRSVNYNLVECGEGERRNMERAIRARNIAGHAGRVASGGDDGAILRPACDVPGEVRGKASRLSAACVDQWRKTMPKGTNAPHNWCVRGTPEGDRDLQWDKVFRAYAEVLWGISLPEPIIGWQKKFRARSA